jgi:hypothetical protein
MLPSLSLPFMQPPVIKPLAATAFANTAFYPSNKMAPQLWKGAADRLKAAQSADQQIDQN